MAKFCANCGAPLSDSQKFCPNCGCAAGAAAAPAQPQPAAAQPQYQAAQPAAQPQYQQPQYQQPAAQPQYQQPQMQMPPIYAGNGAVREGIPQPGFSDRVNHPEILAAMKKSRRAAKIFALFLVPLPLAGFLIYSLVSDSIEVPQALLYGGVISAVFLLFAVVSFLRERAKNTYEAVVLDQSARRTYRHKNSDSREMTTEYTTVVQTTDGRKKKIVEYEGSQIWAYNYLSVGDRFRYHPQFHFPYELYDKSRAPYLVCVSCGTQNPTEADRCKKCSLPLLK